MFMERLEVLKYYSRKDVQEKILNNAKNREIAIRYGDKGYGARPDIVQFKNDIFELAKQGATSFHISEEIWKDPLRLKTGLSKKELDELRHGWDLIIDVDTKNLEYAKVMASLIVDALRFHDVDNFSIKFSGGSGFHIGIPFEAFPSSFNNQETRLLFPECIKVVNLYLRELIREPLRERLNIKEPFSVVDIDSMLMSSRHLYRSAYSFNEKTGLISIPIRPERIMDFRLEEAEPINVKTNVDFLENFKKGEAKNLLIQAYDWFSKTKTRTVEKKEEKKEFKTIKNAIEERYFPPCISLILKGIKDDGRKRSLFILLNFLKQTGYSYNDIQTILNDWNKRNYQSLGDVYTKAQVEWHKKQDKNVLPPNCDKETYYKSINVCKPDNLCKLIKNPVNYSIRKKGLSQNK